jgi:hypothetical protein
MSDTQTPLESSSERWPAGIHWDQGPWHGRRARFAAFLASLCVAAGGGWLGYNHGMSLDQAGVRTESAQAGDSNEFGIGVDTAVGAVAGFLGSEVVLSLGLVSLQRRHILNHPESYASTIDAPGLSDPPDGLSRPQN